MAIFISHPVLLVMISLVLLTAEVLVFCWFFFFKEGKYDRHCHQECNALRLQTQKSSDLAEQILEGIPLGEFWWVFLGGFVGFAFFHPL